ncbi:MAG: D-alanyl-D-alanine carboxypeptidase family protein [Patescibacteria group bacterium]
MRKTSIYILLFIFFIVVLLHLNNNECEIVSGNEHIYRGQCLASDYSVSLVTISNRASYLNSSKKVNASIKDILEILISDAEKDGMCLVVFDAYRSPERQAELIELSSEHEIDKIALPYQSEHQTGLAIDFTACPMNNGVRDDSLERLELRKPFKELPEYDWLVKNSYKYNIEQSFNADNSDVSGYPEEPWHWKFLIKM